MSQIGVDRAGQLNFPEFIDLIHFIGVHGRAYKHSQPSATLNLKAIRTLQQNIDADSTSASHTSVNQSPALPLNNQTTVAMSTTTYKFYSEICEYQETSKERD